MAENTDQLTHLRPDGAAHMVDIAEKGVTKRRGVAVATLRTRPDVIRLISNGTLPKGEALGTARLAGIMAAKATSTLIPLCHPIAITSVDVTLTVGRDEVDIVASVTTLGRTGVEMEALTAASVAGLTLYDMIKAVDRTARITDIAVIEKEGGRSGHWVSA
ncbi:cyclic pyranopterin monophosphate synthase MoaC [Microbacterium testaceum]|uniref:Cyclic pyranopterin monophosphate synthase n=2 Tax=Microbacterium testaceum TaxID=2033 RepID=A0A2T7W016_MICTE|nr:cyclic pyranopterin monophosphate synthase MoaC [Microbacterium testaceum]